VVDSIAEQPAVREPGQRVGHGGLDEPIVDRGVLEGDRYVVREEAHQLEVVGPELPVGPVQAQRADDALGRADRGHDHRLGLDGRARDLDRPWIVGDVVDNLGLALLDDVAGDPGAEGRAARNDLLCVFVTGKGRDEQPAARSTR